MTHQEMSDMYELYALGVLEPDERSAIDEHLAAHCPVCESALKRALATNALVLSLAPETAPPKRLKTRLMASAGVEPRNWSWLAWAAASACLLVGMLWFSSQSNRKSEELEAARRVLEIVNSPETRAVTFGAGPRGNIYVHPKAGVLLIASNLPKLEPGKTFEMWVIPKSGPPKPAGLFRPDANGNARHLVTGAVDLSTTGALAVSVEPETGSSVPTTQPILVAPMAGS